MSPEQCAKSGTEDGEQAAVFCWAAERMREGGVYLGLEWMFAIPNGGSRGATKSQAMGVGARLKATGVKAGVSDIFLPLRRHGVGGLFIEMKKAPVHGGSVKDASDKQKAFILSMLDNGYGACVCCGWQEAVSVIEQYLAD